MGAQIKKILRPISKLQVPARMKSSKFYMLWTHKSGLTSERRC